MGKYIGHRLVARPELAHTFWTDNTSLCCRPALYSEALWYTGMENQPTKFTVYQVLTVSVEKCLDDFFLQNGGGCQKLRGTLEWKQSHLVLVTFVLSSYSTGHPLRPRSASAPSSSLKSGVIRPLRAPVDSHIIYFSPWWYERERERERMIDKRERGNVPANFARSVTICRCNLPFYIYRNLAIIYCFWERFFLLWRAAQELTLSR